jgi:tetratricopeptide (TPR) repeat protein
LTFALGDRLVAAGREAEALSLYDDFLKLSPDYPDAIGLYNRMETMARELHQPHRAEKYARQIANLAPAK